MSVDRRRFLLASESCFYSDVSVSGHADLVDDNTKKRDLWDDSLKAW